MSSNWEDLHDIAADLMSPGDIVEGKKSLRIISDVAFQKISKIKLFVFLTQCLLCVPLLVSFAGIVICAILHRNFSANTLHFDCRYMALATVSLIAALSYFLDCVQFRPQLIRWLRLPPECHPQELILLLDGLRSGAWKAKTERGILPDYIFESEWNILLFSGAKYKAERRWLCRLGRVSYDGDIEACRVTKNAVELDQPPLAVPKRPRGRSPATQAPNSPSTHSTLVNQTHWLVAIPESQFEAFLEAAVKTIAWEHEDAPRKVRIVLFSARKFAQLQQEQTGTVSLSSMRVASVEALEKELADEPKAFIGLSGKQGDRSKRSDSWIELLLRNSGNAAYSDVRRLAQTFTLQSSKIDAESM